MVDRLKFVRLEADPFQQPASKSGGYGHHRLRSDCAEAYREVRASLLEAGGLLTSSGSRRNLKAKVSPNRSATSLHYLGRALDLYLYSGMVDPHHDPYVVVRGPGRRWRVWARAEGGDPKLLKAWTYSGRVLSVEGTFVDLTGLFAKHGFRPIPARSSFFRGIRHGKRNDGGAEWWHFQWEVGLVRGETTFGDELLRVYTKRPLEGTAPWKCRDRVWGTGWR